jgi:hypothetical protein
VNEAIRVGAATLHEADFVEKDIEEELNVLVRELQADEKQQRQEEEDKLRERLERLQLTPTGCVGKETTVMPITQPQESKNQTPIATLESSS